MMMFWDEIWMAWRYGNANEAASHQNRDPFCNLLAQFVSGEFKQETGYREFLDEVRATNDLWRGRALYVVGWYYYRHGNLGLLMAAIQAGLHYSGKASDFVTVRHMWQFLAAIEEAIGCYDEAHRCFLMGEQALQQFDIPAESMFSYSIRAAIRLRIQDREQALADSELAIRYAEQVPDSRATLMPRIGLATQLEMNGEEDEARAILEGLLREAEEQHFDNWLPSTLIYLGRNQLRQSREEGEVFLRSGIEMARQQSHKVYLRLGLRTLHESLLIQSRMEEAREVHRELETFVLSFDPKEVVATANRTERHFLEAVQ